MMTDEEVQQWNDEFDRCCDNITQLTRARDGGSADTRPMFFLSASQLWLVLDKCPDDLVSDCRQTANMFVGDYLRGQDVAA